MSEQYNLIPSKTDTLPIGDTLIFAPHPDDETFGLGGSILKLIEKNQIVNVIMMTNGSKGGDPEVRKKELLKATTKLGLNEVYFFGAKDGQLQVTSEYIRRVILLLETYQPNNVFFPSPFEYHPDHRATAWIVWNALQSIDFKGTVFSYEIANQSPINTLIDITSVMQKKIEIMNLYVSQNSQIDYIETITAMNRTRAYTGASKQIKYVEALFKFPNIKMGLTTYYYKYFHNYHKGIQTEKLPLVSVLIRTKNRPKQLENALESLLQQTYQQFEVNIVNDGGENIESIVSKFNFEYTSIINHTKSKGRAAAANTLLKMAKGEYAIFLDDDDTFDADHIESLVRIIQKNKNILAVYSGIRIGKELDKTPYNKPYNPALLRYGNYIPIHAVLFSLKLIEKGCMFDEQFDIYEDWDFWLQVAQHTDFYHLNKITATYNLNGDSGVKRPEHYSEEELNTEITITKIYKKWLPKWSASELYHTYKRIGEPYRKQIQNLQNQVQELHYQIDQFMQDKYTCPSIDIADVKFYPLPILNQKKILSPLKVAVIIHVYYSDLFDEMLSYVDNIEYEPSLFISVNSKEDYQKIKKTLATKRYRNISIKIVPNRGRDIAPFLIEFSQQLQEFDLCCKIHSKKSLYLGKDQKEWREHLFYNLLGNKKIVNDIINAFYNNENLGLLFSDSYYFIHFSWFSWTNNKEVVRTILQKLNLNSLLSLLNKTYIDFPAGSMFWFRPKALSPLLNTNFSYHDFPEEPINSDGTIAHGIERLIAYIVRYNKYDFIEQNWKRMFYSKNITHKNFHQKLKQFDQIRENTKYLNHQISLLLQERIQEHDIGNPIKRNFKLVSSRNYEKQCIRLFEEVFKEKMSTEFWQWKYSQENMIWRGVCALKKGEIIGYYNGMYREILYFGKQKKALAVGDIMVSPKARGGFKENSPFYTMTRTWGTMNLGPKKQFLLAYGFPNKRHMLLAEKVSLYEEVDTITEVHWHINNKSISLENFYIEKYISNKIEDSNIKKLWEEMALDFKTDLIGVRNIPYLEHRYINHPKFEYMIYLLYDKMKNLCCTLILKKDKSQMLLMDIIAKKENFKLGIKCAIFLTQKHNCNLLKCWITTSKINLFRFYNSVLHPTDISIPTSSFIEDFDPKHIKNKWFLMYGDTDFI